MAFTSLPGGSLFYLFGFCPAPAATSLSPAINSHAQDFYLPSDTQKAHRQKYERGFWRDLFSSYEKWTGQGCSGSFCKKPDGLLSPTGRSRARAPECDHRRFRKPRRGSRQKERYHRSRCPYRKLCPRGNAAGHGGLSGLDIISLAGGRATQSDYRATPPFLPSVRHSLQP